MYHIINGKGPPATPQEIASHFNVIMMAGAVTTATFLSGVLYYLGHNRQALESLRDEIRSTFPSIEAINSKGLLGCVYLNAVIEEGLRIYPPAGAAHLSRIVPKGGCVMSGSFIPEGVCFLPLLLLLFVLCSAPPASVHSLSPPSQTRVSVHPWSILRDPTNFHAPSQFIPERWIETSSEGRTGDKLDRSLPFSYGPRGCLGRKWVPLLTYTPTDVVFVVESASEQKGHLWLICCDGAVSHTSKCAWFSRSCFGNTICPGSTARR